MSSIGAVIARARTSGGFSKRKRFTIARDRAIEKMRRFALADPYFYILELIQAAVANEAQYIDIEISGGDVTMAYVGGGLREADLAGLFDYLFASKDRSDIGHLRELALGINAALLFRPSRVIVESGDGTMEGTSRLEMHGSHDAVDIGKPERPMMGTYVRLEGLRRDKLPSVFARMLFGDSRSRELGVIESRCLAAPVPIILNHQPLFGFSAQRTPALLGYRDALAFDEGDLYGTLGLGREGGVSEFDLLMWGVHVQSKEHDLVPGRSVCGVVCFDRLRKTADHSGIVEDDRLEELWARLLPYAEQLAHGTRRVAVSAVAHPDGRPVPAATVRELARTHEVLVLVPGDIAGDPESSRHALDIGTALKAPVLCGDERFVPALRAMSGGSLRVLTPDPRRPVDVRFYAQALAEVPQRPWLTPPVEVDPLPLWKLAARIHGAAPGDEEALRKVAEPTVARLGRGEDVRATVFTPDAQQHARALVVELLSTGRLVWTGAVASSFTGHVLRVELPDAQPSALLDRRAEADSVLCVEVGQAMAQHAVEALSTAFGRAVSGLAERDVRPGTGAAGLALQAAARTCIPRLSTVDGEPKVVLDQLEAGEVDLRELPILQTRQGQAVTLQDVVELMNRCEGLVYGTVPGALPDLGGLDESRVLDLDANTERSLVALFGESSFVRVDGRDVLARSGGAMCRDIAVGLRGYPDHALLIEGSQLAREAQGAEVERELVQALVRRFMGADPPAPVSSAEARDAWQECRRHAARMLQWYVCELLRRDAPTPVPQVFELPLFLDDRERAHSVQDVVAAMHGPQGVTLVYGHAYGGAEMGALVDAARADTRDGALPRVLMASPFLHRRLAGLGPVRVAFDFALSGLRDPQREVDMLVSEPLLGPGLRGVIGIPSPPVPHPEIAVLLPDGERTTALTSLAFEHGCVGWVRLDASVAWEDTRIEQLEGLVRTACESCLQALLERAHQETDLARRATFIGHLLGYARRHLTLIVTGATQPVPSVFSALVDRVLSIPVFPSRYGEAMGAWRLVRRFCALFAESPSQATARLFESLSDDLPAHLRRWIETTLCEASVVLEPSRGAEAVRSVNEIEQLTAAELQSTLSHWLHRLRPDPPEFPLQVWIHAREFKGLASVEASELYVSPGHELVSSVLFDPSPRTLAWLLLALYAKVNADLDDVTNAHERRFHSAVSKALRTGKLGFVVRRDG